MRVSIARTNPAHQSDRSVYISRMPGTMLGGCVRLIDELSLGHFRGVSCVLGRDVTMLGVVFRGVRGLAWRARSGPWAWWFPIGASTAATD